MLQNENDETKFIEGKDPKKIYISKRINHKATHPQTGDEINIPLRYVSKVINSEKILGEVKEKGVLQLRITDSGKQEILAKVLEVNNKIYVLTLQRYTKESGSPHKIHFSFVGNEILELRDFIDSIILLNFPDEHKTKVESADLLKIKKIFSENPDIGLIEQVLKNNVTDKDIVALGYRKSQLDIFRKLLEENYLAEYKKEVIKNAQIKDELAFQHFFNKNPWIFGYGLDYRFMGILQKEFSASGTEADGSGQVNGDFLIGDEKFTTFVELKKPDTPLFKNSTIRSGVWKLSTDLMEAKSQILEQKASGQIKIEKETIHNSDGKEIKQKSYDSKVILIIGNWGQVKDDVDLVKQTKIKTFELFRRDSRNIEIITYDELYDRAK
ncbi:MAG: DUF4263 domain-containing protein, partial [Candidatus Levybacteria bacterium]|nr:DUF4263 domain-containing protein [Candidatus Levybacteria bacterium]